MRIGTSLLALIVSVPLLSPNVLGACSCPEYRDAGEGFKNSDLVFTGRVTAVSSIQIPQRDWIDDPSKTSNLHSTLIWQSVVSFEVLDRWKGNPDSETFSVLAGSTTEHRLIEDCDAHFELEQEYLVFARGEFLVADSCAPTGFMRDAGEAIAVLDRLAPRKRDHE